MPVVLYENEADVVFLAKTLTGSVGVVFTMMLLLIFIPVAIIHNNYLLQSSENNEEKNFWSEFGREIIASIIPVVISVVIQFFGGKG